MQNKLQELTDKLYNEGLSKGKQDAENLVNNAKSQAENIIKEAQSQAEKILSDAKKEADELKIRVDNDIKMASSQTISAIKQQVESLIITQSISSPIKENLSDKEFLKEIISSVIKAFNASNSEPAALELILPENMQKDMDSFIGNKANESMHKGVEVTFSKQINNGFKIGPKGASYIISFTDGDFERLIAEYLRPVSKKLLFG